MKKKNQIIQHGKKAMQRNTIPERQINRKQTNKQTRGNLVNERENKEQMGERKEEMSWENVYVEEERKKHGG